MATTLVKKIFLLIFIFYACEDVKRVWDNPYDPRSDRSLWTPDSLTVSQKSTNEIELNWFRKGRDFDGFKIDKKVGEADWQDSVAILWDSIYTWIDTLDLKAVVNNPVEYAYRIYAYADSNISNKVSVNIKPAAPGPPDPVDVISVSYTNVPLLTVEWNTSIEGDFSKYHLYQAQDSTGTQTLIESYTEKDEVVYTTESFDPKIENWFWIEVEDSTGQKTKGKGKGHPIDQVPTAVVLDTITYSSGFFNLKWSESNITDFREYVIQQTNMNGETVIFDVNEPLKENTSKLMPVDPDEEQYFRIITKDYWQQTASSNIRGASSYQRIVKVDKLTDNGDKITIFNRGPSVNFSHVLVKDSFSNSVKAYFPIWIQDGEKVFALNDGSPGLVVNQDGTKLRIIDGVEAQDIAFNSNQSLAVFTGSDHNVYLVNLNEDTTPTKLTTATNNEWYGDPEFIDSGELILYWQRKHQANNNVGVKDIFSMDLDGKNVKQISKAQNVDKFIMPRMSPDGTKILYVQEGDGLYIMNYPTDTLGVPVTKSGGQKIIPESSKYFRNIRWSSDSEKAILWAKENNSYFLYVFQVGGSPELTLFQTGARYASWLYGTSTDTVIFRSETSDAMYKKAVSASSAAEPILFYNGPWAQLQPRQ
ncbi:MAG: hypothetical protein QF743_09185 [Candidatus Marinimicrobia bacterium]|nr:hypothetical protein [Candidatus Neomarinimicrobiota bacterium]MDP6611666.1 hypothetical protein [Candidatus Neomarinimicrobiota bacterium]